jgi:hypothetical protein
LDRFRRSVGHHRCVTDRLDQLVRDARTLAYAVLAAAAEALDAGRDLQDTSTP